MRSFFRITTLALATASSIYICAAAGCLGEGDCRDDSDCSDDESCVPPFSPSGCGACIGAQNPCMLDSECKAFGEEYICGPVLCACNGELECVPGCTADSQCLKWEFCGPDHRCAAKPCTADKDCLPNFICTTSGNRHCARKSCDADSDCDDICVLGMCHDGAGTCSPPVP